MKRLTKACILVLRRPTEIGGTPGGGGCSIRRVRPLRLVSPTCSTVLRIFTFAYSTLGKRSSHAGPAAGEATADILHIRHWVNGAVTLAQPPARRRLIFE